MRSFLASSVTSTDIFCDSRVRLVEAMMRLPQIVILMVRKQEKGVIGM